MKDAVKHAVKHIVKQSKTPAAESAPETASFERTPKAMLLGAVLVLLGGVLWGINATVSKLLMADYHADPLWIACVRELAAGALFLACAGVRTPKLLAGAVRDRRSYPMLLFAALTCVLFVQVSYLSAIDWTNSGTAYNFHLITHSGFTFHSNLPHKFRKTKRGSMQTKITRLNLC